MNKKTFKVLDEVDGFLPWQYFAMLRWKTALRLETAWSKDGKHSFTIIKPKEASDERQT